MAEEEKLMKQTKSMLRAVLISAPRGVVARKLQAEYKSITGTPIPYQRLGYSSLEDFLRSIPDVIHDRPGATGELTFFGVADSSTEHIAKLVSKQRKPKLSLARSTPPRAFFPRQNKFFGHHSPMKPGGPGPAHYSSSGPRRPPQQSSIRMVPPGPEPHGLLLSVEGVGRCREDLSKAVLVPIRGLSGRVSLPKNKMLKVNGFVSGGPQLRTRWVSGREQHFGSVLIRDSIPRGFTILCLFVAPHWDVDKNTDFHRYLSDGDAVVVYAYPEVIKTPKYQNGKSVALQTFALQMNPKSHSPAVSQSKDPRSFLPPNDLRHTLNKHTPQEDPNDLRPVIAASQQDLRAVINDNRQQQQSGVREVMLSDVTSPTASTAPRKQSSPLTGADAQLERDIYEIIKPWPSGTIWRRVEVLYKNKFQRELPSNTLELVGRMESVMVEELACGITAYPVVPLPPITHPSTPPAPSPSVTPSCADGLPDTVQKTPLNVGENVAFIITNVRSPSCFYGYKMDDNERIHELIRVVHSMYQTTPSPVPEVGAVVPGMVYAAQFSDDQIWYRAMVKSVNEHKGIFNVFYLEFGNEEEVPRDRLRPLSAELASLPPLTVQLALSPADVTPDQGLGWSTEATSKFSALVLDKEVHTIITSCIRDTSGYRYEVQAKDLVPALVEAGIASPPNPHPPISAAQQDLRAVINDIRQQQQPNPHPPMEAPQSPPSQGAAQSPPTQGADSVRVDDQSPPPIPSVIELPDKFFDCYLSHVLSPASFYIQRVGPQYHEQLEALENDMAKHFAQNSAEPVNLPKEDSLVALRSVEEDGSTYWYRAKVVSVLPQESKVEVKLLDYGNTDVVDMKDVMLLPSKFYQLPFQAVHCCLRGLSDFLESPKIYETFMAYQDRLDLLTAKVVASPGTRVTLELMDQENIEKGSINVQLMSLGTPIAQLSPEMPSVGERVSVNVTDISAGGVVSLQLHGPSLPHLDELMKLINAQYSQKATATSFVQDVAEGMLCCAKCDNEWYRVKVLKVEEKSVHVEYTDSGKTATLERRDLRKQLKNSLFTLPPQAVKCRLADLPPPNGEWKEAAVSALWDTISDCLCEIEVVSRSPGDLPLVRMWCKVEDGEEQDLSALMCAQPEAFGLPPVPQEPTSDQEAVPGVSTDPYEDFAFETDTTGEEDEAQGSGGKSESDPLQDSKGGVSTSENAEVECPTTDQPVPAAPDAGPGATDSDRVPLVSGVGMFDGAEQETFEGRLVPPHLAKETFVPVYVSYVSSPTDFWLAPCTHDVEYKRFRSALEAHCSQATPTEPTVLMEGTVCAVKNNAAGEWVRVQRLDQTQASLIDSGGLLDLSGLACVQLPSVLSQVPPLAIRCSLCGLRPDSAGHWSTKAVTKFSELVERQNLCALAVGMQRDGEQRRHLVELVDTTISNSSDIIISAELVQMHSATAT